jgi:hypothetical protein
MSDNKPPCECIESVNGRWTYRCECSNGGDAEGAAYWVAYENARIETADTIIRLTAEVEWHKKNSDKWQDTQAAHLREVARLTLEVERKDAALKQAGTGLNAGLFQYAARDIHGNIVPGDGQYPWIRAMQIGLDFVTAALSPPPALSGDKQ